MKPSSNHALAMASSKHKKPSGANQDSQRLDEKKLAQKDVANAQAWPLPDIDQMVDENQTNAIGLHPSQLHRAPSQETEIEDPTPLTADDIEAIRQAAFEEGFNQGKEEGFSAGYNEGKELGHQEGIATGHEEGLQKGLEEGKTEVDQQSADLKNLVEQFYQPLAELEQGLEQQLLAVVTQLTEAITYHEAKTNPDILLSALNTGLKALPSQEPQTQILLNPADIQLIEQTFDEQYIKEQGWQLLAAPQLPQGSCQIENSTSSVDLNLKSRIKDVISHYLEQALHQ